MGVEKFVEALTGTGGLGQVAPVSTNLILAYIGEHVLEMPRSF